MIKYLGSKRRLVGLIGDLYALTPSSSAADVFAGTTRVGQELKHRGAFVHSIDYTSYSDVFARCYIETDLNSFDMAKLESRLSELMALPPTDGYFVTEFCREARFFTEENGCHINSMWDYLRSRADDPLWPLLMTSLIEAADRVDSTVGVQMAYLKQWAARALLPIKLRVPDLIPGKGVSHRLRLPDEVGQVPKVDFAYFDPPYNQHSYMGNYHIWETMARGDTPATYGVAHKRTDIRDKDNASLFNRRNQIKNALYDTVQGIRAEYRLISYSDDTWLSLADLLEIAGEGAIALAVTQRRYIGSQIGIYNPSGDKVGKPGKEKNKELLVLFGPKKWIDAVTDRYADLIVHP